MAEVKIRKLEDWVVATHRARAKSAGHSLEEELRLLVTEAALAPQHRLAEKTAEFKERLRRRHGELPDSTPLVREDRDARG
jgi:plasmid stability protein